MRSDYTGMKVISNSLSLMQIDPSFFSLSLSGWSFRTSSTKQTDISSRPFRLKLTYRLKPSQNSEERMKRNKMRNFSSIRVCCQGHSFIHRLAYSIFLRQFTVSGEGDYEAGLLAGRLGACFEIKRREKLFERDLIIITNKQARRPSAEPMSDNRYVFIVEWFDTSASLVRTYNLTYYT